MKNRSLTLMALLGLGVMGMPLLAAAQADQSAQPEQAVPGTVNYVQGTVYLNGSRLNTKSIGNVTVEPGQQLSTGQGKVEMLLTPGVFVRLDDNSTIKMVSPDLAMTQVELEKGRAGVEVDEIHDENDLQVIDADVTTRLNKRGYYQFDANHPEAMVFKGEAHVQVNDNKWRAIKDHHEFALNEGPQLAKEKPQNFNENEAKGELYNWNSLRSQYMAEANNQMAADYGGPYYGPGWYWDPWAYDFAYMGFGPFDSPFGWGFYPFGWGGFYPWGAGFYGGYGHYGYGHFRHGYADVGFHGNRGTFGSFHGGGGFGGGGFGGFHGGGGFAGGHH